MFLNIIRLRKVFKYINNALERRQESQRLEDQVLEGPLECVVEEEQKRFPFYFLYTSYYNFDDVFEIGLAQWTVLRVKVGALEQ